MPKSDLTQSKQDYLAQPRDHLTRLLREEEIKYYQLAKAKDVLLGDNNTRYFHMIANGEYRKKRIFSLENGDTKIEGLANLKCFISEFYKGLFGESEENSFTLDESRNLDIPQVSSWEKIFLMADYSELKVRSRRLFLDETK